MYMLYMLILAGMAGMRMVCHIQCIIRLHVDLRSNIRF